MILWTLLFVMFAIIGYLGNQFLHGSFIGHDTKIEVSTLKSQLVSINELATKRVDYREEIEYESEELLGKKFIMTFDGIIKAGINMDSVEISVKNSEEEGDSAVVSIKLPQAIILSHNDENVNTVYEGGLFESDLGKTRNNLIKKAKAKREKLEIKNGLLDDATEEAKTTIEDFVHKSYGNNVKVLFEEA